MPILGILNRHFTDLIPLRLFKQGKVPLSQAKDRLMRVPESARAYTL